MQHCEKCGRDHYRVPKKCSNEPRKERETKFVYLIHDDSTNKLYVYSNIKNASDFIGRTTQWMNNFISVCNYWRMKNNFNIMKLNKEDSTLIKEKTNELLTKYPNLEVSLN
jgi:hypothetical protein